jgi:hypothetical protein
VNAVSVVYGLAIFALMLFAAVRPRPAALYVLWIIFLVAVGVNAGRGWIYPAMLVLLLLAVALRLFAEPSPPAPRSRVRFSASTIPAKLQPR